tara:strand:- start:430 stop:651 length:222 start_codon:yes stop_codon:yes gene_type:complete
MSEVIVAIDAHVTLDRGLQGKQHPFDTSEVICCWQFAVIHSLVNVSRIAIYVLGLLVSVFFLVITFKVSFLVI